ncbi:hypothetical protein LK13_21175 [Paenibacillus polymyxa]|jgi:hypothetical protein|uniref:Uncharacterized protein n=1 Tax=Paenibacillus polymyxa TaxID=1406 RepID=A0A0F6EY36_PAEPO|nr:hypothetical protein [Paenibacillus polymyxa]AHM65379.1 hypothetical protein PPSQR21_017290 [Paenibacillus polymyxa SQR-21]AIY10900.1 hypothetical protein LK13_21175 [Paenibacillus polymyxa]MBE7896967.1 hypothetical protein [Paenibacillus polymyxa]MBG9762833.1 hypothetical protein [Paenibacillus polymyxa]MCC3257787.1 hypothetical protein [Paenibacillus polymyxa]
MKKAIISTLGLALLLTTSTAVASAQEAQEGSPALQKESIQLFGNGTDREPNNWFDEASEILVGVDIYGEIGKHIDGGYDNSDYYKFKAFQSGWYQFNIQGDIYPNTWLRLGLADSNGHFIRYANDREYSLGKNLEAGKWYYLVVETPGAELGQLFDYKVTSTIK